MKGPKLFYALLQGLDDSMIEMMMNDFYKIV